jgi:NH3-dependent NAD+ synthetase
MTSPQDRITDAVRRGQETVNSTVKSVTDAAQKISTTDAVRRGQETVNATVKTVTEGIEKIVTNVNLRNTVPSLEELVDSSYTFAVQVLAMQRDLTKSLISYAQPWTETLSNAPKKAEQFVLRTEKTAAKKAEDVATKAEATAAEAEKTATKAQRSAAARSRSTKS